MCCSFYNYARKIWFLRNAQVPQIWERYDKNKKKKKTKKLRRRRRKMVSYWIVLCFMRYLQFVLRLCVQVRNCIGKHMYARNNAAMHESDGSIRREEPKMRRCGEAAEKSTLLNNALLKTRAEKTRKSHNKRALVCERSDAHMWLIVMRLGMTAITYN